ncbi:helix-turn-helix domain-containing protein [Acidocella aquatica]|uniref:helix-turn-helix domain-containing protein n=1 Tax=Acidocella aquatica TaxID=1922313 RepID=UPI0024E1487D|nr:helix-turn-helix domain-containing protein [Acidocella aquatica]
MFRFKFSVSHPDNFDELSSSQLRDLVLKLFSRLAEVEKVVADQREGIWAEADLQRHFRVTPPAVHDMVLSLERAGLIRREPSRARSISLLVDPMALPPLQPGHLQPVKTTVTRY